MRPICITCKVQTIAEKNGIVIELRHGDKYYGHKHGDLYRCPSCFNLISTGFGRLYHDEGGPKDYIVRVT